jgi:hypothetical protein
MTLEFQPIAVATGSADREGALVLLEGRLLAVLVRLSDQHGTVSGRWFLEHGFGRFDQPVYKVFPDLNAAREWFAQSAGIQD